MIADSERREVARRLRELNESGICIEEQICDLWEIEGGSEYRCDERCDKCRGHVLAYLADLIDPDCEEGRYSVARTARPVDRDALLELAEDVEEAAAMAVAMDASKGAKLLADMLLDIARRIRDALGVSGDE